MRDAQTQAAADQRAEVAVLGAVLLDNAVWPQAAQLNPSDFSLQAHQRIFERMRNLFETDQPVDMITLIGELDRRKELETIGGVAYLSSMIDGVPERPNISHYVAMIRRAAGARAIVHGAEAISDLARKGVDIGELRDHLIELHRSALQYESVSSEAIRRLEDVPDICSLDPRAISYILPDLIPRGAVVLLTGSPGVGKSSLAQKLVVHCAFGWEFLGRPCEQVRCLYLDKENPLMLVQRRMEVFADGPVPGLHIWGGWLREEPPSLEDPRLLRWAGEHQLFICFDSLVRFHAADENSASEMRNVMAHLRRLADAGATVLLLHHRSKSEANKYRGSSDILAAVDMAYALEEVDGLLRLHRFKSRFSGEKIFPLRADFAAGTFELLEDKVDADERADDVETIRGVIVDTPGLMTTAICAATQKRGVSKSRTLALLERETGRLWRWELGRNRSHCFYILASIPGVPAYKAAEHRNIPCSPYSVGVPGTPERTDNKADHELSSVDIPVFRNTRSETQHPEHANLPETSKERPLQPLPATERKERVDL